MKKEVAIKLLEGEKEYMVSHGGDSQAQALDKAIKALEQEPCEDCWRKKEVVDIINRQRFGIQKISMGIIKEKLEALPSVTPTRKKGKWIAKENIHGLEKFYECSNCGNHCLYEYVEIGFQNAKTKYCPNCGAEMESESEERSIGT